MLAPHRMHLKGPWRYEWIPDAHSASSNSAFNCDDAPSVSGEVRLPADWRTLFGDRGGTICFLRRFGRPTNLEPHEQVFLVFDRIEGTARIFLNGQPLGTIAGAQQAAFDATALLVPNNELAVEVTFHPASNPEQCGGLCEPVALEVRRGMW
jgi:hypothetical protein